MLIYYFYYYVFIGSVTKEYKIMFFIFWWKDTNRFIKILIENKREKQFIVYSNLIPNNLNNIDIGKDFESYVCWIGNERNSLVILYNNN